MPGLTRNPDQQYQGKGIEDADVLRQWQEAAADVRNAQYADALARLEAAAQQAQVPVVFNNLGVLYAKLNDGPRAIQAFREALVRDSQYQPVRFNMNRLKFLPNAADPVTHEIEPNGTLSLANVIGLGMPVEGEISAGLNDVDCYRLTSPPSPRDLLAIEIVNHSRFLAPRLHVYDIHRRLTEGTTDVQPGEALKQQISPPPNTTLNLEIDGYLGTSGAYTLTVRPLRAFDAYEPNDDILSARRISIGETIQANIMDAHDTDYYSFAATFSGTVSIEIASRSTTLVPALTTFTPDKRKSASAPEVHAPGARLHLTMEVQADQVYYLLVWSQGSSFGAYSLTIG